MFFTNIFVFRWVGSTILYFLMQQTLLDFVADVCSCFVVLPSAGLKRHSSFSHLFCIWIFLQILFGKTHRKWCSNFETITPLLFYLRIFCISQIIISFLFLPSFNMNKSHIIKVKFMKSSFFYEFEKSKGNDDSNNASSIWFLF